MLSRVNWPRGWNRKDRFLGLPIADRQNTGVWAHRGAAVVVAMYPEVRAVLPGLEDDVLESYEEHHVADVLVAELAVMTPDAERFDAKTTVLIENVTDHMDEQEQDWFPKVRAGLGRKELQHPGARMMELKKTAPTSPAHLTTIGPPARRSVTSRSPSTYPVPEHLSLCTP